MPDPTTKPDDVQSRSGVDRRGGSLRSRLALLTGSVLLSLLAVEAGFRLAYRPAAALPTSPHQAGDDWWRQRWLERHRGRPVETFEGSDAYHPTFGWKPRPNLHKARFDKLPPVSTNARGWRNGRDFDFAKPQGVKRMVLVGDSFTFGEQEEDEHIWPAVLAEMLPRWEVINLAVHGYGTDQQYLVLRDEGVRYRPDVVVVGFFVHNVYRNVLSFRDYAKPRFALIGDELRLTNVPVPTPQQVLERTAPAKIPSYALHWVKWRLGGMTAAPREDLGQSDTGRVTRAILAAMKTASRTCGAEMLVVIIPNPPKPAPHIEQMVVRWAGEIGYQTLGLREPMTAVEEKEGRPTYTLHFSRLGHVVAARAVLDKLLAVGWVGPAELADRSLLRERYRMGLDAKPLDPEAERVFAGFLSRQGKLDEALAHYEHALETGSTEAVEIHTNMGTVYRLKGDPERAAEHYQKVIELDGEDPRGHMNLGDLLLARGDYGQAAARFRQALRLKAPPGLTRAKLGAALAGQGQIDQAIRCYEQVVATDPSAGDPVAELVRLLARQGRFREALDVSARGLERSSKHAGIINARMWILATCRDPTLRDGAQAVKLAERLGAIEQIRDPVLLDTIAAAHAESGRCNRAAQIAERALGLAKQSGPSRIVEPIEARLRLYRAGRPFHDDE